MDDIRTDRLILKALKSTYADLIFPIWNDEEAMKYTYIHSIDSLESCKNRLLRMIEGSETRNDVGPYAIFLHDELIGIVSGHQQSLTEYALWYHLSRKHWGYGYATEASKAVVDAIFLNPQVMRISAEAVTTNPASSRVLEKLGMKKEGCLRMKFQRKGVFRDFDSYSIIRNDYAGFIS